MCTPIYTQFLGAIILDTILNGSLVQLFFAPPMPHSSYKFHCFTSFSQKFAPSHGEDLNPHLIFNFVPWSHPTYDSKHCQLFYTIHYRWTNRTCATSVTRPNNDRSDKTDNVYAAGIMHVGSYQGSSENATKQMAQEILWEKRNNILLRNFFILLLLILSCVTRTASIARCCLFLCMCWCSVDQRYGWVPLGRHGQHQVYSTICAH